MARTVPHSLAGEIRPRIKIFHYPKQGKNLARILRKGRSNFASMETRIDFSAISEDKHSRGDFRGRNSQAKFTYMEFQPQ